MQLKTIKAAQGVTWVRSAFRVFFRQPLAFSALFVSFAFVALLLAEFVPLIGPVLAMSLMPAATVAMMLATREALAGHTPSLKLLLAPLKDPQQRSRLLQLGAMYAAATLGLLLLLELLDGGRLEALMSTANDAAAASQALADPMLAVALLMRLFAMALLSLTFWHAPALVYWAQLKPAKAVFASVVACWRARGAFAVYGLSWFAVLLAVMLVAQFLFAALGQAQLVAQALVPVGLVFSAVLYVSVHFSFADAFALEDPPSV